MAKERETTRAERADRQLEEAMQTGMIFDAAGSAPRQNTLLLKQVSRTPSERIPPPGLPPNSLSRSWTVTPHPRPIPAPSPPRPRPNPA